MAISKRKVLKYEVKKQSGELHLIMHYQQDGGTFEDSLGHFDDWGFCAGDLALRQEDIAKIAELSKQYCKV